MRPRLRRGYFEALYAARPRPVGLRDERVRARASTTRRSPRSATAATPPALELGCSIGVLSERLAARCDALLGRRRRRGAARRARAQRVPARDASSARELPEEFPAGPFDLIVCSEVLYYLDALRRATLDATARALAPGGSLLAVHWRPATAAYR